MNRKPNRHGKSAGGTSLLRSGTVCAWACVVAIAWTAAIGTMVAWFLKANHDEFLETARSYAKAAHDKDISYQSWVAKVGGVYAAVSDTLRPNPYLSPQGREITTPSGKVLTLVNPAYMMRQVHETLEQESGIASHITSLKPIRPANAADAWETAALRAFEDGKSEYSSIEQMNGQPYMRLMKPLFIEKGCLKCHAAQGYQLGEVRGGISVAVPISPLEAMWAQQSTTVALGYGAIWLVGLGGSYSAQELCPAA